MEAVLSLNTEQNARARLHGTGHNVQPTAHPGPVDTELVLIRGLPGSGKSTMARVLALVDYQHFEADQYFMQDGVYRFDGSRIREAHAWCQDVTRKALLQGHRTVVSNTFTQLREMAPYQAMSRRVRVIEAQGHWGNVHGVPEETLLRMAGRWEPLLR